MYADPDFRAHLLGGLVTLGAFTLHGAYYLALKTDGPVREGANLLAKRIAPVVVVVAATFLLWTQLRDGRPLSWALTLLAAVTLVAAVAASLRGREGWAFSLTGTTLALTVASLFATLYPNVMVSSTAVPKIAAVSMAIPLPPSNSSSPESAASR